jgi:sugar lactone lactonase YvrE
MKNLYIADRDNHCIRKVDPTGIITTIAGNNVAGFSGDGGNATLAKLSQPSSVATDRKGNIYICDAGNRRIRVISSTGVISTYAGNGTNTSTGDGGPATNAGFTSVYSIAVDRQGNLYISENIGFRIRKVDTNGIITTFAGTGVSGYYGDGGAATAAQIRPYAISADNSGNLLFTDTYNYRVRKIDTSGRIITVAGNGSTGAIGIGSLAIFTGIGLPVGVVSDDVGNIFISSTNQIFQVDTFGIITKFAGNGSNTYNGDGLPATNAAISGSASLAFDKAGDLLIADVDNYRVRIIYNAKVTVSAAQDTVCLGSGTVFTSVVNAASVYSPHYHWVKNGFPVGTDSFRYTAPVLNNGDIVYCYITDGLTGPSIAESNRKTMVVVTPTILPSVVAYLSSSTSLCAGTTVTCNAVSIVNGGSAPTIDWYKNGVHVFTGLLYTFIPSDHDIVNCKLTSSLPCLLVDTAMSSNIVFTVTAPAYPTIRITNSSPGGGGSRYCAGSIAHCSINSRSLDVSPVFEWFLNGVDTFTGYNYNFVPRNGDYVVCRMITMATCVVTDTVFSNTLVFGVDSPANPTVTITSDTGTSICSGIKVNCTAAPVLGGTSPSYSWYVNGALKAPSGNTYSFTPSDGDSLYCVMVSNSGCLLTNSATSNPLKFTYITPQPASVSIAISPSDTICLGETLTATATPVNGGTAPRFRWHVGFNSIDAGPTYTWTPTTDQPECWSSLALNMSLR